MSPLTPYPITPIGSLIGFVLSVLPLASHLNAQPWNTGILVYAFWVGTMNFTNFVGTIVWHDNVDVVIPVWCDIVTKLQTGAAIGVPACALVLSVHLFRLSCMRGVSLLDVKVQRRRELIIDLSITLGVPFIVMALWIVIQPSRFELLEEFGCKYEAYSYITYIIFYLPQLLFDLIAAGLAPFTLQKFLRRRNKTIESIRIHPTADPGKYLRVVAVTCLTLLLDLPILIVSLTINIVEGPLNTLNYPYTSWDWIHEGNLNEVDQRPVSTWSAYKWQMFNVKWSEWIYVLHAIVFFAIFGTTPEATRRYGNAVRWVLFKTGLRKYPVCERTASNSNLSSESICQRTVRRNGDGFLFNEAGLVTRWPVNQTISEGDFTTNNWLEKAVEEGEAVQVEPDTKINEG